MSRLGSPQKTEQIVREDLVRDAAGLRRSGKRLTENSPTFRVRYEEALFKQIGMAAGAVKGQICFISGIDQEPVGFDVTFSVILPFT